MRRRTIFAAATAVLLLMLTAMTATLTVSAQTPRPPGEGRPPVVAGDIVWAFGEENPLFDQRVAGALGTDMAPRILAAAPAGARIVRVEMSEPGVFPSARIYPTGDVPKLLAAAGYGQNPLFVEVGQCKVWVSPAADPTNTITASAAAPIITGALQATLASMGVTTRPCVATSDPAQAHVLVWVGYGAAPTLAMRGDATFLGAPARPPAPSANSIPGGTGGGPRPATTGSGGLAGDVDARPRVLGVLVLSALCAGARLATRREARV